MHRHYAWGLWAVEVVQCAATLHGAENSGKSATHYPIAWGQGWGKIGLRPRGVTDVRFPTPPPLLARPDGTMTTGTHSPLVPPLAPTVVVFMSGLFRLHPIARGGGGGCNAPPWLPVGKLV